MLLLCSLPKLFLCSPNRTFYFLFLLMYLRILQLLSEVINGKMTVLGLSLWALLHGNFKTLNHR